MRAPQYEVRELEPGDAIPHVRRVIDLYTRRREESGAGAAPTDFYKGPHRKLAAS
jgi:hypothetical protein